MVEYALCLIEFKKGEARTVLYSSVDLEEAVKIVEEGSKKQDELKGEDLDRFFAAATLLNFAKVIDEVVEVEPEKNVNEEGVGDDNA